MTNIVRVGFESGWAVGEKVDSCKGQEVRAEGIYKAAWLWVEGWRARLRAGGDLVEKCRYDTGE